MSESNRIPGDRQHLERLIDVWVREGSGLEQIAACFALGALTGARRGEILA